MGPSDLQTMKAILGGANLPAGISAAAAGSIGFVWGSRSGPNRTVPEVAVP